MTRLRRKQRQVPEVRSDPQPGVRILAGRADLEGAIARAVAHERATARHLEKRRARYDAMAVRPAIPRRPGPTEPGLGPLLTAGA